jgi:hypothetical protein
VSESVSETGEAVKNISLGFKIHHRQLLVFAPNFARKLESTKSYSSTRLTSPKLDLVLCLFDYRNLHFLTNHPVPSSKTLVYCLLIGALPKQTTLYWLQKFNAPVTMSKQMIETFFPAAVRRLQDNSVGALAWPWLYPDQVAQLCPEVSVSIGEDTILRQPVLAVSAVVGMLIGVVGSIPLYQQQTKPYWALAFLAFGLMNMVGLQLHCLVEAPHADYPQVYPMLWMWDCYMTGVSSSFLLLASLQDLGYLSSKSSTRWLLATQQLVGALPISFFVYRNNTYPLELWYLIPPLLAGPPILLLLFGNEQLLVHWKNPYLQWRIICVAMSKSTGCAVFLLGAVTGLSGVVLDVPFCFVFQNSLFDLLTSGTLLFLGCNLAFGGIFLWLASTKKSDFDTKPHID